MSVSNYEMMVHVYQGKIDGISYVLGEQADLLPPLLKLVLDRQLASYRETHSEYAIKLYEARTNAEK